MGVSGVRHSLTPEAVGKISAFVGKSGIAGGITISKVIEISQHRIYSTLKNVVKRAHYSRGSRSRHLLMS